MADVTRDPMQGPLRRMPWDAPVWNAGIDGNQFVPGLVRRHVEFWQDVMLPNHPLSDTLVSFVRDGVNLHDLFLMNSRVRRSAARTTSPGSTERCFKTAFHNRLLVLWTPRYGRS